MTADFLGSLVRRFHAEHGSVFARCLHPDVVALLREEVHRHIKTAKKGGIQTDVELIGTLMEACLTGQTRHFIACIAQTELAADAIAHA